MVFSTLRTAITAVSLLSVSAQLVQGKLFDSPAKVANKEYDFIVIGAGTAGNLIASRLTEDSSVSVLLIEAGVSNEGVEDSIVPFFCTNFIPATPWTWNYTTTPQVGFGGRSIPYPRGRLLGGSSSINFLIYTRGSSEDFDRYANVSGDPGWSWDALQPYIKKNEHFGQPADHHNTTGEYDPDVHGYSGPLHVSLPGYHQGIEERVVATTDEVDGFPFNEDMNSGYNIGIGYSQFTIGNSKRSSSATAYLEATNALSRPNLDVVIDTQVTKLIPDATVNGVTSFYSAEFASTSDQNTRYQASAKKEIILSAGSVNSPQILMLSGIGNATTLATHNISSVIDLPEVGQNLQDHPLVAWQFSVNSTNTLDVLSRNATYFSEMFALYNATGTGPLVDSLSNLLGWIRIPDNSSIYQEYPDPTAGPNSPHIEMVFSNGYAAFSGPPPETGNYMSILTNVISPLARGSVTLASDDPFDFPIVDPGFLNHPFDQFVMTYAASAVRRFVSASAWDDYVIGPYGLSEDPSPKELTQYIQSTANTLYHPVATARMTTKDSTDGVVNPNLTLKKAKGLRIVDASVIPYIPGAHTQAAVYIFAERAADLIKQAYNLS